MILWFAAVAFAIVVLVFQSPLIDYRLVIAGAVLPTVEHLWGGPWIMHTLLCPVVVMTVVMLGAWGRRLVQRRWLGLAIGLFLHLVLDGSWRLTSLFWWPVFGTSIDSADTPSLPPTWLLIGLELVGALVAVWAWRRYGLGDAKRRTKFFRTGHLDRHLLGDSPPTC